MTLHPPMSDAELWAEAQRRLARMGKPRTPTTPPQAPTPSPGAPRGVAAPKRASTAKRKPKAPPVPRESQEQAALIGLCDQWATRYPELARVYSIPNAGGYSGGFGSNAARVAKALREGVRPGYPDLGLDVAREGRDEAGRPVRYFGLRIELKRQRGGKVAPEQTEWHEWLRSQGYRVEVCKGADAAWAVLLEYLGIATMPSTLEGVTDAAA